MVKVLLYFITIALLFGLLSVLELTLRIIGPPDNIKLGFVFWVVVLFPIAGILIWLPNRKQKRWLGSKYYG
jgi:hypothetical protein